jgi:hypothetical protein
MDQFPNFSPQGSAIFSNLLLEKPTGETRPIWKEIPHRLEFDWAIVMAEITG